MDENVVIKVRNGRISKKDRAVLDPFLKRIRDFEEKKVNHAIRTMRRGEIVVDWNGDFTCVMVRSRLFTEEEKEQVLKVHRPLRKLFRPLEKMSLGITEQTIQYVLKVIQDEWTRNGIYVVR